MKEEELRKYYDVYTDCWKLFRRYSIPDDSKEFWERLRDEMGEIWNRHGKSEHAKKILLATRDEIERLWKKGKQVEQ